MTSLDLVVLAVYLGGVLFGSAWIAFRQRTGAHYFLAGRRLAAAPLALSIAANQVSAVSVLGAPAFVALHARGGLRWLQYELALPLAALAIGLVLLRPLRAGTGNSIYAWAEQRYGRGLRRALAACFVLARGLTLGAILYASALAIAQVLELPLAPTLVALGVFSVAYTGLGGLEADVWSDVLQLVVLWCGLVGSGLWLLATYGTDLVSAVPPQRFAALDLGEHGLAGGSGFGLAPMLVGGFFLYVSYYACDQTQAQRLLAARDEASARRALVWTGLLRFPLAASLCGFGLLLAGLLALEPDFAARLHDRPIDSLVPQFLLAYLPGGLRGLLVAAILAAAMSSIDSALNSLAAVTLEDVLGRDPERERVGAARACSFAWGVFGVGAGLACTRAPGGVLVLVNQIGSAFGGPMLAVFALGVLAPRTRGRDALAALACGFLACIALARLRPEVAWLWWAPVGFGAALLAAVLSCSIAPAGARSGAWLRWPRPSALPRSDVLVLLAAFAVIAGALALLPRVA